MIKIDFLNRDYYNWANQFLALSDPIMEAFYKEIDRINCHPERQKLAREFHELLYHSDQSLKETNDRLLAMGPSEGMFVAVVYASGLPSLIEAYQRKGIPLEILRETLSDFGVWMDHHYQQYGVWGLSELGWLKWHFHSGLFKLGRLQFMPRSFDGKIKLFRNKNSDSLIALSDQGISFDINGQLSTEGKLENLADSWVSILHCDGTKIKGNRITSTGKAIREPIELSVPEWELILEEGDQVLDVHIPVGGKMTYELCEDSYRQAIAFVDKHLSKQSIKAFTCTSWLLSPQLGEILPETSNIVKFQRDYYCIPNRSDDSQIFERVFGEKPVDLSKAPRDTFLRRALLDYLMAGNTVRGSSGFKLL